MIVDESSRAGFKPFDLTNLPKRKILKRKEKSINVPKKTPKKDAIKTEFGYFPATECKNR